MRSTCLPALSVVALSLIGLCASAALGGEPKTTVRAKRASHRSRSRGTTISLNTGRLGLSYSSGDWHLGLRYPSGGLRRRDSYGLRYRTGHRPVYFRPSVLHVYDRRAPTWWPRYGWDPPSPKPRVYNRYIIVTPPPVRAERESEFDVLQPRKPEADIEPEPQREEGFRSDLSPSLGGQETVGDSFALGEERLRQGMFQEAALSFGRAALGDPDEPAVDLALAIARVGQRQWPEAAGALRAGLARHPDPGAVRLDLRPLLGGTEAYEKMVLALGSALEHAPQDADGQLVLGFLYFADGYWSKAEQHLKQAADLDPTDPAAARIRALALGELERERRKAAEVKPPDQDAAASD